MEQINPKNLEPIFSGLQKFSSIDYKGNLSLILFTGSCNFRCSYCHNPEFVIPNKIKYKQNQEIIEFLQKRKNTLDAVVICGGEPTIHNHNLILWIKYIKSLGYKIKLDTNATNPKLIKLLINKKLIDYFAIDYKAPIKNYKKIIQTQIPNLKEKIITSLKLIINSKIPYEIRSTIHNQFHSESDLNQMIQELKEIGIDNYFLQNFIQQKQHVGNINSGIGTQTMLKKIETKLKNNFKNSKIRNLN